MRAVSMGFPIQYGLLLGIIHRIRYVTGHFSAEVNNKFRQLELPFPSDAGWAKLYDRSPRLEPNKIRPTDADLTPLLWTVFETVLTDMKTTPERYNTQELADLTKELRKHTIKAVGNKLPPAQQRLLMLGLHRPDSSAIFRQNEHVLRMYTEFEAGEPKLLLDYVVQVQLEIRSFTTKSRPGMSLGAIVAITKHDVVRKMFDDYPKSLLFNVKPAYLELPLVRCLVSHNRDQFVVTVPILVVLILFQKVGETMLRAYLTHGITNV
jgi:hypothetical protein